MKFPSDIPRDHDGQYCLGCQAASVERTVRDDRVFYQCASCGAVNERSLVVDSAIHWWIDVDGTYWHESAGVIVVADGKILTGMRRIYPFGISVSAAGHVDAGERPEVAALRELREETGIVVDALEPLLTDYPFDGDSCRRGCDHHLWHLYRARLPARPEVVRCDETSEFAWMTAEQVAADQSLTPAFKRFVEVLGAANLL